MKNKTTKRAVLLPAHETCKHANPITGDHLKNKDGSPILGRCPYSKDAFLLTEKTKCEHYVRTRR